MIAGKIDQPWALFLFGVCVCAAVCDLSLGKIFNWITVPLFLAGLCVSFGLEGWPGLGAAFLGSLLAALIFGWMFFKNFLGGGDLKLLIGLGAWLHPLEFVNLAACSILLGGCMAILQLVSRGRLMAFVIRLRAFLLPSLVSAIRGQGKFDSEMIDRSLTLPFGVPIAAAVGWMFFVKGGAL